MEKKLTAAELDVLLATLVEKKELTSFIAGEIAELEAKVLEQANGNKVLVGDALKVKIVYRENVSYPDKDKLATLVVDNQDVLGPLFRTKLEESGSKVTSYLEIADTPLAKELRAIRVVKDGKPTLTVEPIVQGV